MDPPGQNWQGEIKDLAICAAYLPYVVSCRVRLEGETEWRFRYFSVDREIGFPATEDEILRDWVVPRLQDFVIQSGYRVLEHPAPNQTSEVTLK